MFNVGGGEIIVIMLIALIVLGPQRLPDAARQIGKTMGELRRLSNGFQNEVRSALDTADDPTRVAARRNVLAKEEPVDGGTEVDDTAPKRPVRTEPLVAGPPLEARNGADAKPATPKKAASKKPLVAKKAPPKKAAAKKAAAPKNGTAVNEATTNATSAEADPPAEAAPSSPPTET